MAFLFVVGEILVALFVIIIAYYKWSFLYWKRKNVPTLEPSIPFGNIKNPFYRKKTFGLEMMDYYQQAKEKGWKYFGIYAVASPTIMFCDLDLIKMVLTQDFNHFIDRGIYTNEKDDPLGVTLFAVGGTKWKNLRHKLSPSFSSGKMKMMFDTLVNCTLEMEKYLDKVVKNNEPVDIKEVLSSLTTDIIGSCAFGLECNSFKDPNSLFRQYGRRVFTSSRWINFKSFVGANYPRVGRALGFTIFGREINEFFTKIVRDTVQYREENNIRRNDFLQLVIDIMVKDELMGLEHNGDGTTLTIQEVAAQTFVFFIAGFETSSTTMTYVLYELSRHPDLQERLREEIYKVLQKHDNKLTYDSLSELTYMNQVIDESLRKYPAVPFVTRVCVQDWKIPDTEIVVEKDTLVFIPIMGVHYDPDNYENPEKFDPERFNEDNVKGRHPYAHLAFGEGPRTCIGKRFGIMQTKVGLTAILKNYRFTVSEKTIQPLKFSTTSFVPTNIGGIWLNMEKINL